MELFDVIINRRSIRKYSVQPVDDDTVEKIIHAGMYAPSAVNKQPWHFVVFDKQDIFQAIVDVLPNGGMLKGASKGILVCYDEKLQHDTGYGIIDCSAATQNMLLAAHAIGLGACWVGVHPRIDRINHLIRIFSLPDTVKPFSIISLGYPAESKEKPDRIKKERIHNNSW